MIRRVVVGLALLSSRVLAAQHQTGRSCEAGTARERLPVEIPAGASVAVIDSASLAPFFDRTLSQALAARLPGVSVMQSNGVAGGGSRIRLRGASGIIGTHQPVLYVDGVRVDGEPQSTGVSAGVGLGGYAPSRVDDIPVDDIECIYVLRGPATTAVYGTDAAYGVIHILTRDAASAPTRVDGSLEAGVTVDPTDYPANYGDTNSCARYRAALGQCTPGTPRSWSPLEADDPFRTAPLLHASARATVFSSSRAKLGVRGGATLRDGALRINNHRTYNAMTTGQFRPVSALDVDGSLWYLGGASRMPLVGNPSLGILNSALQGTSFDDPVKHGYRNAGLSVLEQLDTDHDIRRLGGIVRARWTPVPWLAVNALAGREDSRMTEEQFWPTFLFSQLPNVTPPRYRLTAEQRSQYNSASASATMTYGRTAARLVTNLRVDYMDGTYRAVERGIDVLAPDQFSSYSYYQRDPSNTGFIAKQSLTLYNRLIVDGGVRVEKLSRDFVTIKDPTYPFASAALVPIQNPRSAWSLLRIRAAYGENGESRWLEPAALSGVVVPPGSSVTLPPARVELTRELEGGIDLGLFADRVNITGTYFNKQTEDGLTSTPVAPGVGGGGSLLTSSASWENRGVEVTLGARLIDTRSVRADLAVSYTSLKNDVRSLGGSLPIFGTFTRVTPGYPLYGFWAQPFTFNDQDGDGVIVPAEVTAGSEPQYAGSPIPTREIGIAPRVTFLSNFSVTALLDYRGGFRVLNQGGRFRCNGVCSPLWVPTESLAEQARAVGGNGTLGAWMEDGTFLRLRELAASWDVPASFSKRMGARTAQLVLVGRNLLTSTDYTGLEPEGTYTGQTRIEQTDLFVLPLPRTVSLRLNMGW